VAEIFFSFWLPGNNWHPIAISIPAAIADRLEENQDN